MIMTEMASASQLSGCSELGLSDAQLAKLACTCDPLATDGNWSAGASARAYGYTEDQQEQIKRVYNKAYADAHKALAHANKALAGQSAHLGNEGPGAGGGSAGESGQCGLIGRRTGVVRISNMRIGRSEFGLSDAQLAKLACTCDLCATGGNVPAGASACASGYSEDQQEQTKRVYKARANAHKALAYASNALADQSALLGKRTWHCRMISWRKWSVRIAWMVDG